MNLEKYNLDEENIDNIIFKNKYLKYKKKYNILKDYLGGLPPLPPKCPFLINIMTDLSYSIYKPLDDSSKSKMFLLYKGKYKATILDLYEVPQDNFYLIFCNDNNLYLSPEALITNIVRKYSGLLSFNLLSFNSSKVIKFHSISRKIGSEYKNNDIKLYLTLTDTTNKVYYSLKKEQKNETELLSSHIISHDILSDHRICIGINENKYDVFIIDINLQLNPV